MMTNDSTSDNSDSDIEKTKDGTFSVFESDYGLWIKLDIVLIDVYYVVLYYTWCSSYDKM